MRHRRPRGCQSILTLALALASAAALVAVEPPAHLVPRVLDDGVILNVPQRMIFVMREGAAVARYPVGLGRPDWPTFVGPFSIVTKEVDPVWDVPLSIQEELRRSGKVVLTRVAPGPGNPLGKYWLGLSVPGFGIHGTNAPRSISRFQSHGCIRLLADDIADLFARVEVGTPGVSIYEPIVLALIDGALWMEAHPDVYRLGPPHPLNDVFERAARAAPGVVIDTAVVTDILRRRDGRTRRIDSAPVTAFGAGAGSRANASPPDLAR
jgi:L,D-transpeptidase ErfK/SrfK